MVVLATSIILISCRPESSPVTHAAVGNQNFFIPKEYLDFGHTSAGPESALLQAWYPGSYFVPDEPQMDLVKKKLWRKQVRILFGVLPETAPPFDTVARKMQGHFKSDDFIGHEYGLSHYINDAPNKARNVLWQETDKNGSILSYITCSEKDSEISVPQCQYHGRFNQKYSLKISYHRDFLPEWRTIRYNVTAMMNTLNNPESAIAYAQEIRMKIEQDKAAGLYP